MLFFSVKEGETVEPDHAVCDAAFAEAGGDRFGDSDYDLDTFMISIGSELRKE